MRMATVTLEKWIIDVQIGRHVLEVETKYQVNNEAIQVHPKMRSATARKRENNCRLHRK